MASQFSRLAAALFSTTALVLASPAFAQDANPDEPPVYLEADSVVELGDGAGYLARGEVRAQQGDRTVFADEVEYRPAINRVIARGNVQIHGGGQYPQYADEVELDSELSTGIALGFASMLENDGRMAAASAIRQANGSVQLENAYYTACPLCEDGETEPTWRVRAREVIQDADDQMIYYRDAQLEVLGVPVLYAPVFAHPDPSSERRSGFLFPDVGLSSRLGALYQQPYLWAISPSQDLVVAPRVMTNVNPLLFADYRKRFWSGTMELEGSWTDEFEIDSEGDRFGEKEHRWHLFGGGRFDISDEWRWGFGVQRVSDDLHLRRYDFSEDDDDRGAPLEADARRLVSQLYVEGRTPNSYGSIISASYQSLRTNEDDDTIPNIMPMLQYRRVFNAPEGWGRVNLDVNGVFLDRTEGSDYQRLSTTIDWRTRWVAPAGIVVEPFAYGRVDAYHLSDIPLTGGGTGNDGFDRQLGLAGAEVSWPFFRGGNTVDVVLEPVISATIATDDPAKDRLINEDSLSIDLDESLLFDSVRAPGFDLWEEGQRISYGVRASAFWGSGNSASAFIGQSHRMDGETQFDPSSGLATEDSDYVVSGELNWGAFRSEMQARLDSEDYDVDRIDASASYTGGRVTAGLRYLDVSDDDSLRSPQREVTAQFTYQLTARWSMIANVTRDLDIDTSRRQETGFRYEDDCTRMEIVYERQDLGIDRLGPSESIQFRVALFTLGSVAEE
ncbi:LPS assembly protein LptD [Maricaulis sp.]|uniref:LPS-assembly protein LptD n=1 Tax=Maricaulis sp. TaxID=1486257 RepID=UPI00261500B1|nr:LPS assembly protein LptD [Maricaulis sp.]